MPERSPTSPKRRWLRPVLFALALAFAASTILYTTLWMLGKRWAPDVDLGFDNSPSLFVTRVQQDSPAEKAGLLPGDQILTIDGTHLEDTTSLYALYKLHKPGDTVHLTIARPAETSPVVLTAVLQRRPSHPEEIGWTQYFAELLSSSYPVPFILVGLVVLFLRLEDRRVWHLALLFASFTPGPVGIPDDFASVPAALRPFAIAYQILAQGMLAPLFYWFFAVFPTRSPLDRRLPWLKWMALVSLPIGTLSLALPGLSVDGLRLPALPNIFGEKSQIETIFVLWMLGFVALGVVSLASNFFQTTDPEARRKIGVIFWGTTIAFAPLLVVAASHFLVEYQDPPWLDIAVIVILFLFPLSFAYAVVKHRVLEIPVLLKRSARYLLVQRGFTALLGVSIGVTLILASSSRYLRPLIDLAQPAGIALGAVFGTMLLWGGAQLHKRVSVRIDRAFFRSAYDARVILEDLAEKTLSSTDRGELARLLEHHLKEALQPSSLAVYFQGSDDSLAVASASVPNELQSISTKLSFLTELAQRGQPREFPTTDEDSERSALESLHPECLVPVMGRGGRMAGLLILGPRLSEGPYSGEDKRLLASIAGQAGTALENIRLAEQIADRLELDRRADHEMQIARDVQSRLFPQVRPPLATLDYAGSCIQARQVGGDFYDFLDLGSSHMAFVLADISGKGIAGALLMANLQANLRSRYATALDNLPGLLKSVNHLFYENTPDDRYATLFCAVYDDPTREFNYANCGHNAPLIFRADGSVEQLTSTATVIGLFPEWECATRTITLYPNDVLVMYTDGVTEANDAAGKEFGESRLRETVRGNLDLSPADLLTAIQEAVQKFNVGEQFDDLTLVVARAR